MMYIKYFESENNKNQDQISLQTERKNFLGKKFPYLTESALLEDK